MKKKIDDSILKHIKVSRVFQDYTAKVNSIDFAVTGDSLVTSSDDGQIIVYDCIKGSQSRIVHSKKYGVDLVRTTHSPNAVLHSSTKVDDSLRYLSLHDNKYLRFFHGHTKRVTNLCNSPVDDTFLSASLDNSLRLWDLRTPSSIGVMGVQSKPVVAYDPEGLIFAAGVHSDSIKLYDLRSFDKGPFVTFKLNAEKEQEWTGLKFSRDGKTILISTNGNILRLLDAFHGTPLQTFTGFNNNERLPLEGTFTPDSQFILCGSSDGRIHIWNADTGYKMCILNADYPHPTVHVQFNPKYMLMATAHHSLAFWVPPPELLT